MFNVLQKNIMKKISSSSIANLIAAIAVFISLFSLAKSYQTDRQTRDIELHSRKNTLLTSLIQAKLDAESMRSEIQLYLNTKPKNQDRVIDLHDSTERLIKLTERQVEATKLLFTFDELTAEHIRDNELRSKEIELEMKANRERLNRIIDNKQNQSSDPT